MSDRFIGRGWAFPLRVGPTGGIGMVEREREIEEAIRLVLGTAPGERPMRPEFGCGIHDHVFESVDAYLVGRIEQEVRIALDRWEPRIEVLTVEMSMERTTQGGVLDEVVVIDIQYKLRATNDVRNLVYPFYVIPAEE